MIEKTKTLIKSVYPGSVRIYRRLRGTRQSLMSGRANMEEIFTKIYLNNSWADPESVSGRGSTLSRTAVIRSSLPDWLAGIGAKSLLDAACGDFNWMREVDLNGFEYIGADVVPELIVRNRRLHGRKDRNFVVMDITRDEMPRVDVILCRDCFIHLSFKQINAAIMNFKRSKSRFLLATTHSLVQENTDTDAGGWRSLNLQLPPFNFPRPQQSMTEDSELGKHLGMWRLEQLG